MASETDSRPAKSEASTESVTLMVPIAVTVYVPMPAPSYDGEGVQWLSMPNGQQTAAVTALGKCSSWYCDVIDRIMSSNEIGATLNALLTGAHESAARVPGARIELTPWLGTVEFTEVD